MIFTPIDLDTINEMSDDEGVWVVSNEENNTAVSHKQGDTGMFIVMTFLKEEDARHFARILKKINPDRLYGTQHKAIRSLYEAIIAAGDNVTLIGPDMARKYFMEEHPDIFPEYYE